jgi:UDP-N-acetylglucosamine transferase subunit ALG13
VVFVTVGNAKQSFRRLIAAVDELAERSFFGSETVLVQIGFTSDYRPVHCEWKDFLPADEFAECLARASLVVSHGGVTQLSAVRLGKVPVVMPRLKKYGEHVNDHQVQLVRELAADGWVVPAYEPADLPAAIGDARARPPRPVPRAPMLDLVRGAIEELAGRTSGGTRW